MSPLNLSVGELIARLDTDLPNATNLHKITEAQARSHTLSALGDQLIGHYVSQARQDGASWSEIGEAIGVSKQAAQQKHAGINFFVGFTDRARHAVVLAQESARHHKHGYIGTEHLLLALLDESGGVASRILVEKAGSPDAVRTAIEEIMPAEGNKTPNGHLPFTPRSKKALELSARESSELGHSFVGTEHVLLGISALGEGIGADALKALGFEHEALRRLVQDKVEQLLREPRDMTP